MESLFVFGLAGALNAIAGALAYLLLIVTPGAWIVFGMVLEGIPFWARFFTAATLSPLVVCAEFYLMRWAGVSFGLAVYLLVILNVPAIYFIWKRRAKPAAFDRRDWVIAATVIGVPLACMFPVLVFQDARIFSPHGWYHADAVYMFARGDLALESPTLAGYRLSYPVWTPLVFQAAQSFVVNSAPVSSFAWSNLFYLIAVFAFAAGIAKEMGGGRLAQACCGLWLILGVNAVDSPLRQRYPGGIAGCCDIRYTEWWYKFYISGPMALAIAMLMAMIYLLIRYGPTGNELLVVLCLLLTGIGLLYPLLFPPACAIVCAKALAALADGKRRRWYGAHRNWIIWAGAALIGAVLLGMEMKLGASMGGSAVPLARALALLTAAGALFAALFLTFRLPYREWMRWGGILLFAAIVTFAEAKYLTSDRAPGAAPLIFLPSIRIAAMKTVGSMIGTSLFLAGLAVSLRAAWNSRPAATMVLVGGALGSYILYAVLVIPYWANEYKFIFSATMCLAAFPAIAVERIWREWPRIAAAPVLALLTLMLLGAYGRDAYVNWPVGWMVRWDPSHERNPRLDAGGFQLKLDPQEPWSGVCNAVLQKTPGNSVLLVDNNALYYPELTERSLYVTTANTNYTGVNIAANDLDANLRGYGMPILQQRRATLASFFEATDFRQREQALQTIQALKRPLAVIAESRHSGLLAWLERSGANRLYSGNGMSLWLIDNAASVRE